MAKKASSTDFMIIPEAQPILEEVFHTYREAWQAGKIEVIPDEQVDQRIEHIIGPLQTQLRAMQAKP